MKIDKYTAINALYEGNVTQLSDGTFEYHSGGSVPSEEAIQAKLSELQAEYDALKYQRDRASQYPSITDVVVALAEKEEGDDTMWQEITAQRAKVKADNPKPE